MKSGVSPFPCPACSGTLQPRTLVCEACELKVEGSFALNEFATLNAHDLHFLRIFVHCEGRIKDMESAMGLSYPTIKSRFAELKSKLSLESSTNSSPALKPAPAPLPPPEASPIPTEPNVNEILLQLEKQEISYGDALELLKQSKSGKKI